MLDPRLFRLRGFSAGTLTITVQFFAAFGFFFAAIQYLQFVTGRSPLESALALLPLPFVLLPVARNAPHLAERVGFRRVAPIGLLSMAIGFLVFSRLDIETDYWVFLLGLVFFALGMGLAGTPATTAITASLPMAKQGVASAVNDTARELGSALGIAILGSLLNQGYRTAVADALVGLPPDVAERLRSSIAFTASPVIAGLGEAGRQLVLAAQAAFVQGVGDALLAGAVVLVVAAVAVGVLAPRAARPAAATHAATRGAAFNTH
jgi:fucose permease